MYTCDPSKEQGQALAAGCSPLSWGGTDIKSRSPADIYIEVADLRSTKRKGEPA